MTVASKILAHQFESDAWHIRPTASHTSDRDASDYNFLFDAMLITPCREKKSFLVDEQMKLLTMCKQIWI